MSVVDLLEVAGSAADAIALADSSRSWNYPELARAVDERADALRQSGVIRGSVHALTADADAWGILTLLAVWRIGATAAPMSRGLSAGERAAALETLGFRGQGAQAILWTSGTSGRPRGVALSFENLNASAEAAARRLSLGSDDVWLASLSPAHVGGLALISRALLLGSRLIAAGRFDAARAWRAMEGADLPPEASAPVTHLSVVPTQLLRLLEHRSGALAPETLRLVLVGGAHAPPDLVSRALDAGWPIALTYGMTEMTSQVTTATPPEVRARPGTVGRPLDGVEVSVAGDGEILVRAQRTAAVGYVGSESPLADDEGWYHTGDLGRLDDEGLLWISGRRAERIVSGGVTVDAVEVESVLREHPEVADACVVGLPDVEWGEVVGAAIVPINGKIDMDALEDWMRARLGSARRPRRWTLLDALPLNPSGKVDRASTRDAFASGSDGR